LVWGQGDAAGAGGKIIKNVQERYTELQCVEYCYVRLTLLRFSLFAVYYDPGTVAIILVGTE